MGRTKSKSQIKASGNGTQSHGSQASKENICWAGSLDTLLSFQMRDEHNERWKPGAKLACGKRWAKAISINHLDRDGSKTKAHVEQLVSRWRSASKMMSSGWGTITKRIKKDGEWVTLKYLLRTNLNL